MIVNFFINDKAENIFILSLLLIYYICNFTTITFFIIKTYILIKKGFLHNSSGIKFNPENQISIQKKFAQKKIFLENLTFFLINSKFFIKK